MARKPSPEPDDKEQSERFVETARKLESDESGKAFDKAFQALSPKKKRLKGNRS